MMWNKAVVIAVSDRTWPRELDLHAVITLLFPVLSILEMGTPPRTKYWTN